MCFPIKKGDYPVMKKTLKVVSAMLAVLLILLSFAGCNMFTISEESTTTTEYSTSLTEKPADTAKAVAYFNSLLEKAVSLPKEQRPDISWEESIKVSDKSIKITSAKLSGAEDETVTLEKDAEELINDLNNIAPIVKNYIIQNLPKQKSATTVPDKNGNATAYEDILYGAGGLSAFDTSYAVVIEDNSDENLYKITIRFNDEYNPTANSSRIGKAFDLRTKDDIFNALNKDAMKGYADVKDYDAVYKNCSIYAVVNRLTDEIISIEYRKNVDVTAKAELLGKLAPAGEVNISFTVENVRKYEFEWPILDEEA